MDKVFSLKFAFFILHFSFFNEAPRSKLRGILAKANEI
jgi:hypothetical protein